MYLAEAPHPQGILKVNICDRMAMGSITDYEGGRKRVRDQILSIQWGYGSFE